MPPTFGDDGTGPRTQIKWHAFYSPQFWHMAIIATFILPLNLGPIVRTSYGRVQGFSTLDGQIDVFYGIPFAKPPVGQLRFEVLFFSN